MEELSIKLEVGYNKFEIVTQRQIDNHFEELEKHCDNCKYNHIIHKGKMCMCLPRQNPLNGCPKCFSRNNKLVELINKDNYANTK